MLVVQYANGLVPRVQVLAPTAGFIAYLKIGFLSGLILTMPWVIYQIWRFVASGMYPRERRFVMLLIPASTGLFVAGVAFLYMIVLPTVLNFFISFNNQFDTPDLTPGVFQGFLLPDPPSVSDAGNEGRGIVLPILGGDPKDAVAGEAWINGSTRRLVVQTDSGVLSVPLDEGPAAPAMQSQFALDFYISFVLMLALAFGIAFETPIVVFFLAWAGLVSPAKMAAGRRYVLLGMVIIAAVLTPPDVISQILLAGPMYILFEAGLLVARVVKRRATTTVTE